MPRHYPPLIRKTPIPPDYVQIVDSKLFVPDVTQVYQQLIASTRARLQHVQPEAYERLTRGDETRAEKRAVHWVTGRKHAARLEKITDVDARKRIGDLARTGGRLYGPTTAHGVDELISQIHVEAPWLQEVSTFLMRHLRARMAAGYVGLVLPPVILVGEPGVSKSWMARTLGQLSKAPVRQIDVGGGSAGFRISGVEKGWGTACPGLPVETILSTGAANPVMVVDEVDKAGEMNKMSGGSTSIVTSLLQMMEFSTAAAFECPCYRVGFDLRHVNWILTANDATKIPEPLLDRARIFHIPSLTLDDILYHYDRRTSGHPDRELVARGREALINRWRRGGAVGLRKLNRLIDTLNQEAAVLLLI